MQTLNVRQFRSIIPNLKQALEDEHEIVLVSNGAPVARVLPVVSSPRFESRKALRDLMRPSDISSGDLVRLDRDSRAS